MAVYYSIRCPHCKQVVESGKDRQQQYGSPLRTCRYCGKTYYDPNFIEAGLLNEVDFKKLPWSWVNIGWLAMGAVFLFLGMQKSISVGVIAGIALIAFGLIPFIRKLTYNPNADKSLQMAIQESNQRLKNPHYVIALSKVGCEVPSVLLDWAKEAIAKENNSTNSDTL